MLCAHETSCPFGFIRSADKAGESVSDTMTEITVATAIVSPNA